MICDAKNLNGRSPGKRINDRKGQPQTMLTANDKKYILKKIKRQSGGKNIFCLTSRLQIENITLIAIAASSNNQQS